MDRSLDQNPILNNSSSFFERVTILMHREMRTRFVGGALGYAWAYLTPVAWIAFVVGAFYVLGRVPPLLMSPQIFVASGILPYILFRQTISASMRALPSSRYMVYFRPVSVAEILLAASLMELLNMTIVSVAVVGTIVVFFDAPMPADPLKALFGLILAWWLGVGFGRFSAIMGRLSDTYTRSVPIILRPLFWLSGVFFTATELPASSLDVLWYSPLFHAIEIVREGFFLGYHSPLSNPVVPFATGLFFYAVSTVLETYWQARDKRRGLL